VLSVSIVKGTIIFTFCESFCGIVELNVLHIDQAAKVSTVDISIKTAIKNQLIFIKIADIATLGKFFFQERFESALKK